jgi:hypothetical protein
VERIDLPAAYKALNTVGAGFTFFNTLQPHPAVGLYVYLLPKSTIPNTQHDSGDIFLSAQSAGPISALKG